MKKQNVYRELYKIHLYIDQMLHKYPKKYYYTLGVRTREYNIEILMQVYQWALQSNMEIKPISELLMKMEELKLYLKLANEYKIVSIKQLSYLFFKIESVKKGIIEQNN